jgi:hypothetical protein
VFSTVLVDLGHHLFDGGVAPLLSDRLRQGGPNLVFDLLELLELGGGGRFGCGSGSRSFSRLGGISGCIGGGICWLSGLIVSR